MKITVKFFAILRERAGAGEISKDIQDGSTIAQLWASLQQDYPKLAAPGFRLLYAVNQNYVTPEQVLKDGDEVAIIPPVSGGL
jgi:molybdopterin converting factor subunit 1